MQLIQKIFGKKKKAPLSLEQKVLMLESQASSSLETIAKGESEEFNELKLRLVAIKKLPYSQTLCFLAFEDDSHTEVNRTARLRIAQHLDAKTLTSSTLQNDLRDPEQILSVASLSENNDLQHEVLAGIKCEETLGKMCLTASSAAIRYSLAQRIEQHDILRELSEKLKSKDKKTYKLVKSKLDQLRLEEKLLNDKRSSIDDLLADIERHRGRNVDHQYKLEVDRLTRRWNEASVDATQDQKTKIENALKKCEDELLSVKRAIEEEEKEAAKKLSVEKQYITLVTKIESHVAALASVETWSDDRVSEQKGSLELIRSEWHQLNAIAKPKPILETSFVKSASAVEKIVVEYSSSGTLIEQTHHVRGLNSKESQVNSQGTLGSDEQTATGEIAEPLIGSKSCENTELEKPTPSNYRSLKKLVAVFGADSTAIPQLAVARDVLGEADRLLAAEKDNEKRQLNVISGLIRKSSSAVQQGRLKQAVGIRHSITAKISGLETNVPEHLKNKVEALDSDIQKLIDWQAYAVLPKKDALIKSMTKLVGADLLPEALAAKIKKLQEEWRELKQSGLDKDGQDKNDALWEDFKTQADLAYEPCREYFQDLSSIRKENLEKRKALVANLEEFDSQYDWENADWKTVEKVIRTARSELHGYVPVDRSENKRVLESFDKMMDIIQSKLNGEREKNKLAKEQLILQAEKLLEISEMQQAIDAAKRLQAQWKKIGPCHYRDSEALWKTFRASCDLVFERKSKEDDEQRSEDNEKISQGNLLISRLKALSESLPSQINTVKSEKQTISDSFYAIEGIPEKAYRALQREYSKANDQLEKDMESASRTNEQYSWVELFDIICKSNAYRLSAQNSEPDASSQLDELNDTLDKVVVWPEGTQSLVRSHIVDFNSNKEFLSESDSINQIRMLCIRAEIAAGKESLSEDKNLRMEYQVNMLQKGLGRITNENTRLSLIQEWIKSSAIPTDKYEMFFERFKQSWETLT